MAENPEKQNGDTMTEKQGTDVFDEGIEKQPVADSDQVLLIRKDGGSFRGKDTYEVTVSNVLIPMAGEGQVTLPGLARLTVMAVVEHLIGGRPHYAKGCPICLMTADILD